MMVRKIPHRNIALVLTAALLLVPFTGIASADICRVADPTGTPLNVRKRPSQHAPIIGALNNGITVSTRMSRGDWVHIVPHEAPGKSGWVWRKFIDCPESVLPSSLGATIQACVPVMAGKCWRRAARPVIEARPDLAARRASGVRGAKPPQQLCRGRSIVCIIAPSRRCRMANPARRSICARSLRLITWKLAAREGLN